MAATLAGSESPATLPAVARYVIKPQTETPELANYALTEG